MNPIDVDVKVNETRVTVGGPWPYWIKLDQGYERHISISHDDFLLLVPMLNALAARIQSEILK